MRLRGVLLSTVLLATACAEGARRPGADSGSDAAVTDDAAAAFDAGAGSDAGDRPDTGSDDAGAPDAGPPDAGPPDVGLPTDAGCRSPADCDDRLACNGVEMCVAGSCRAGMTVSCEDGVACTRGSCGEPGGACTLTPDDSLCPPGQSCDRTMGCIVRCTETPCRLVSPQCGCTPGAGCYLLADGSRMCSAAGATTEGLACTSITSCSPGLACIELADATAPAPGCLRFCNADTDCVGAGSLCVIGLTDSMGRDIPGVTLCTRACDPITSSGCRAGTSCFVATDTAMRDLTHCAGPIGTGGQGAVCIDATDCRAGFICVTPAGSPTNRCAKWCTRPTDARCSPGTMCQPLMGNPTIGATEYGACL